MTRESLVLMALTLTALSVAGCHTPGGTMMSGPTSAITYESTEHLQKSVSIVDTRTEETIFTIDIPAGKQLTIQFQADRGNDPVHTPDLMYYEVWDIGTRMGELRNSMTVPNAVCRRIDVRINQEPTFANAPPDSTLRVDEQPPEWWTEEGGPVPESKRRSMYDN